MERHWLGILLVSFAAWPAAAQEAEGLRTIPSLTLGTYQFESEIRVDYRYEHAEEVTYHRPFGPAFDVEYTRRRTQASLYAGFGVGAGVQITANLPFVFRDEEELEDGGFSVDRDSDGIGDLAVGAAIDLSRPLGLPLPMAVGLDVKLDSAGTGNAGTGTTEYSPYVALSWRSGALSPYLTYRATLSDSGNASDRHAVVLGAQTPLTRTQTVDLRFEAGYNTEDTYEAHMDYSMQLIWYFGLSRNYYLTPAVSVTTEDPADEARGGGDRGRTWGYRAGLGLYAVY